MEPIPQGKRGDQTRTRHGQYTPNASRDDYAAGHRTSTNQSQPDRSNTTSPENGLPQRWGTTYGRNDIVEEPQQDDNLAIVSVRAGLARKQHPRTEPTEYSNRTYYRQRRDEQGRTENTAQAAGNTSHRSTPLLGHNYVSITINGRQAKVVTGDLIENGTNPDLIRRHTYQSIKMDTAAGEEYEEAQQGKRSSSNVVNGNVHLPQGGAAAWFANY